MGGTRCEAPGFAVGAAPGGRSCGRLAGLRGACSGRGYTGAAGRQGHAGPVARDRAGCRRGGALPARLGPHGNTADARPRAAGRRGLPALGRARGRGGRQAAGTRGDRRTGPAPRGARPAAHVARRAVAGRLGPARSLSGRAARAAGRCGAVQALVRLLRGRAAGAASGGLRGRARRRPRVDGTGEHREADRGARDGCLAASDVGPPARFAPGADAQGHSGAREAVPRGGRRADPRVEGR